MAIKFDKGLLAIGAGAGLGVVLSPVLGKYLPAQYQTVPIPGLPAPWNQTKVFVPIVAGVAAFGIAQFTHIIKKPIVKDMVWVFGFTSLISGIVTGALNMGLRANTARMVARPAMYAGQPVRAVTPGPVNTYLSNQTINS